MTNEKLLNPETKVKIVLPNRSLEYFESHIESVLGFIGNVISIRGFTCTVQIKNGDSVRYIPLNIDCLELV